jgi:PAS domain S-box-containing protein
MKGGKIISDHNHKLEIRKRAEEAVKALHKDIQRLSEDEIRNLVHELQVHQIELEMQNESLRIAQHDLEEARDRYSDLYDFAPVGYFTLDEKGIIKEANLTGAGLLGYSRSLLINKPFSNFVLLGDNLSFRSHIHEALMTDEITSLEGRLVRKDGTRLYVNMECLRVKEGDESRLRVAVSDISDRKKIEMALEISE